MYRTLHLTFIYACAEMKLIDYSTFYAATCAIATKGLSS